jgi:hypothetical protein
MILKFKFWLIFIYFTTDQERNETSKTNKKLEI